MRRIWIILKRFYNVAGALISTGLLLSVERILGHIWRRIADLDTAFDLWTKAGGSMPRLLTYIESPFFGPALIILGFLWAFARWKAEERDAPERTITVTDRIGWTIVAASLVAIFGAMLFDEFLVEGGAPQFAQAIIDLQADRPMEKAQFDRLVSVFAPVAKELPDLTVEAVSAAPNAPGYAEIFMSAFHLSGMTVNGVKPDDNHTMLFPSQASVSSRQMKGLYIGVPNAADPPEGAVRFKSLLKSAGFDSSFANWQGLTANSYVFVVSYK